MEIKFSDYIHCMNTDLSGVSKFNKTHKIESSKSGKNLFHSIISPHLNSIPVDYELVIHSVSPIMEKIMKNHKNINYFNVAKRICKSNSRESIEVRNIEVPHKKVYEYLRNVFRKLFPRELFRTPRNEKKLMSGISKYLSTTRNEPYDLSQLVCRMDLEEISWLKDLSVGDRKKVFLVLLKWIFVDYMNEALRTQFHVNFSDPVNSTKVFIRRCDWTEKTTKLLNKLMKSQSYRLNENLESADVECGTLKMMYVKGKFRPIGKKKCYDDERKKYAMLNCFLEQLMQTTQEKKGSFAENWTNLVQKVRQENKDLFIIKCDVENAFGSVKHEILMGVLEELCEGLPNDLRFQTSKSKRYRSRQYFSNEELKQPSDKLPWTSVQRYSLTFIKEQLNKTISQQNVKVGNKTYTAIKGLVQGFPVSAKLAELYYRQVAETMTPLLTNYDMLYVHADDIFYATTNMEGAKMFASKTCTTIQPYGCRFNKNKTEKNFDSKTFEILDNSTVTYIGYFIDGKTLEVTPKYSNVPCRYNVSYKNLSVVSSTSHAVKMNILKRFQNTTTVKMHEIVFNTIISKNVLLSTVKKASSRQAEKSIALLQMSKPLQKEWAEELLVIIKKSNFSIMRKLWSQTKYRKDRRLEQEMRCTWYKNFVQVYKKWHATYPMFLESFRRLLYVLEMKLGIVKKKEKKVKKVH